MKKFFIDDDFLLTTKQARELYHGHAEKMPVIDKSLVKKLGLVPFDTGRAYTAQGYSARRTRRIRGPFPNHPFSKGLIISFH
jgi:hypothetical protein